jgi:hypothetical protein
MRGVEQRCTGIAKIIIHVSQIKLALGITCPRHRAIWKAKLGRFGRWIPDLEWQEDRLVSVRHKT